MKLDNIMFFDENLGKGMDIDYTINDKGEKSIVSIDILSRGDMHGR